MKSLLMVFIKNPALGKVKTRLAASIGDKRALDVYQLLLDHTFAITKNIATDKVVYYSDFIPDADEWRMSGYRPALQSGNDLGDKMRNAFAAGFLQGYTSVVIIGSDCHELRKEHIEDAFDRLNKVDVVVGPAYDGGYYCLGMTKRHDQLFENKEWSSASVLKDTLKDLTTLDLTCHQLETLHDIDNEEDLVRSGITLYD